MVCDGGWRSPSYYVFRDQPITAQDELDIDFIVKYFGEIEKSRYLEKLQEEQNGSSSH